MDYVGEYDWTECHRGEFPGSTLFECDPEVCARLAQIDPQAEIVFNPRRWAEPVWDASEINATDKQGVWSLYRLVFKGGSSSGDLLRHEFDLPDGASTDCVIGMMRERTLIQPGTVTGMMDVAQAQRHFKEEAYRRCSGLLRRQRRQEQFRKDMLDPAREWDRFVLRGFTSGAPQHYTGRHRKPRLYDDQVRVHVGGIGLATPGHRNRPGGIPTKVIVL